MEEATTTPLDPTHSQLLAAMARTLEMMKERGDRHAMVEVAVRGVHKVLRFLLPPEEKRFQLGQEGGKLVVQGRSFLPGDHGERQLLTAMEERRIRSADFDREASLEEIKSFLNVLVRSKQEAVIRGGLRPSLVSSFTKIKLESMEAEYGSSPGLKSVGAVAFQRLVAESMRAPTVRLAAVPTDPEYLAGDFLEKTYGLPPLDLIYSEGKPLEGVCRLMILEPAKPEKIVTLVYRSGDLDVEIREGVSPAARHRNEPATPFPPPRVLRRSIPLPAAHDLDVIPWSDYRHLARSSPAIEPASGREFKTCYRHQFVYVEGVVLDVVWKSPDGESHPNPSRIVAYYRRLLEALDPGREQPHEPAAAQAPASFATLEEAEALARKEWNLSLADLLRLPVLAHLDPAHGLDLEAVRTALSNVDPRLLGSAITGFLKVALELGRGAPSTRPEGTAAPKGPSQSAVP